MLPPILIRLVRQGSALFSLGTSRISPPENFAEKLSAARAMIAGSRALFAMRTDVWYLTPLLKSLRDASSVNIEKRREGLKLAEPPVVIGHAEIETTCIEWPRSRLSDTPVIISSDL